MSCTTSFNFVPLENNHVGARRGSHPFLRDACGVPWIMTPTSNEYCNSTTQQLHSYRGNRPRRALKAANNPLPLSPVPSGSPSSGWSKWMLLTVIPLIFTFSKGKWGPLLVLKQKLDTAIATVDVMVDVIEDVAEKIDEIADQISEKLPEDSSLKNAIDMIGDLAEKTDKAAECADDLLEQMDDVGDKLEKLIVGSAKENAKAAGSDTVKVDEIADQISEKLPEDSSFKIAIDMIGDLAEKTDKAAERADDLLEQVDDVGDNLEKLIVGSAKENAKAAG